MKVLGISNEVTTCECCGRTNLKKTIVLSSGEGEKHYGSECAARALKATGGRWMFATKKEVESVARQVSQQPRTPARASFGVLNVATGFVVARHTDRAEADKAAFARGEGYVVVSA